jgi:hypothetical protein
MRAIATARRSCVAVRAGAKKPPARRHKANGGGDGAGRGPADARGVFELRSTYIAKPVTLKEVATAYDACHLLSGAERAACYIAHDLNGHTVEKWFKLVERLERSVGPPPSIARMHLDRAHDALLRMLPPSDSPLPDGSEDPNDIS